MCAPWRIIWGMHLGLLLRGFLLCGVLCLWACAARDVTPVSMTEAGDETLDCPALQQQIAENEAAARAFLVKDKQVERANTAKVVASAIPYLGILIAASTDMSNEERVKARALVDRNEWLTLLAKRKGCTQ